MIVGDFEQRAVYKRYNVVGNRLDSVLETSVLIAKYSGFAMAVMGHQAYSQDTAWRHRDDVGSSSRMRLSHCNSV